MILSRNIPIMVIPSLPREDPELRQCHSWFWKTNFVRSASRVLIISTWSGERVYICSAEVTITRMYTRLARATWLETAVRHCDPIYVILARCQAAPACEINLSRDDRNRRFSVPVERRSLHVSRITMRYRLVGGSSPVWNSIRLNYICSSMPVRRRVHWADTLRKYIRLYPLL